MTTLNAFRYVNWPPVVSQYLGPARNLQRASIGLNTAGDNTVIPAPGTNRYIHIVHLVLQNVSTSQLTVILKDGIFAMNGTGYLLNPNGGAFTFDGGPMTEYILSANAAFIINLSAAQQLNGIVVYYVTTGESGGF